MENVMIRIAKNLVMDLKYTRDWSLNVSQKPYDQTECILHRERFEGYPYEKSARGDQHVTYKNTSWNMFISMFLIMWNVNKDMTIQLFDIWVQAKRIEIFLYWLLNPLWYDAVAWV